ncbi:DUF4125 family protein [uncultured Cloacibacillus sp.]|uniref:DUF4125 family protein n=1 Tax=uncultured Cloacibacillus sp. TaxID=889794 RepID=UPI0032079E0B
MEELINEIIALEWAFFDKVQNEGGRAPCQDDFRTFCAMRASQYEAWDEATLSSWRGDLTAARAAGRNPLAEKYGYMMCIDAPEENRALAAQLPPVNGRETRARARRRKKTRAAERSLRPRVTRSSPRTRVRCAAARETGAKRR